MRLAELRAGRPQRRGRLDGLWRCQAVSTQGMRHARSHPALGDGEQPRRVARRKRGVEAEDTAATPVALSAAHRERGAEAATVGRLCRGRDDVLAHGNGVVRNVVQSGWRAGSPGGRVFGAESAAAVPAKKRRTSQAVPSRRESRSEVNHDRADYIRPCSLRRIYIAFGIDLPVARRGAPGAHRLHTGRHSAYLPPVLQAQLARQRLALGGEGLVQLDDVHLRKLQRRLGQHLHRGGRGAHAHGARCHAGRGHHAASLASPLPSLRDPPPLRKRWRAIRRRINQVGRKQRRASTPRARPRSAHATGPTAAAQRAHKGKRVSALRC